MLVEYRKNQLEKVCTNASVARREYGDLMARKIFQRIGEIAASETVEAMVEHRLGRCHPLTGDRQGQYAVDLVQPYRMVFTKEGGSVQVVTIEEIVDYH